MYAFRFEVDDMENAPGSRAVAKNVRTHLAIKWFVPCLSTHQIDTIVINGRCCRVRCRRIGENILM